jgi:hypothetical protein
MLSANMPLNFYALTDGATLFAVSGTADSACFSSRIASEMDWFNDRMRLRSDPTLSGENARLKDLRIMRLYERRRVLSTAIEMIQEPHIISVVPPKTVVPEKRLNEPRRDPLPVIWSVAKNKG